ncbi:PAS domain-containing protein, partial [Pantoea sp. SIMBA_133]
APAQEMTPLHIGDRFHTPRSTAADAGSGAENALPLPSLTLGDWRFRELLMSLSRVAVQGYDRDRRVIYWNGASQALYGYSEQEALGKRL